MKKTFLFFAFIAFTALAAAQTSKIEQLKKELDKHSRQDTFRVNRLNELAGSIYLTLIIRRQYANEAITISKKINYKHGWGIALTLLASVESQEGKLQEAKVLLTEADAIAKQTGDLDLQAYVLRRRSLMASNKSEAKRLMKNADAIAGFTKDFYLQSLILTGLAVLANDKQEKIVLLQQAEALANKAGDLEFQTITLRSLGSVLQGADNKKALYYYEQSERLAQRSGNLILLSATQKSIGTFYQQNLTDYGRGMEYYLKSLHSAEIANDTTSIIIAWTDIGSTYSYMGDQATALMYFQKAEAFNKKTADKSTETILQSSLGERYRLLNRYPEAINAYNKAIQSSKEANINDYYDSSNLADVYTRMDSLPLAFHYAFSTLKTANEKEDALLLSWLNGILSRAYLKKGMPDSAVYYGRLGLEGAKKSGTIESMRDNTLALANAYAAKKDFANAYANHLLYVNYRDSMMNEEIRNRTAVQQYTYNLDKKEAQITTLGNQKKYQRNLLTGAMVLLILILASAVLLLRNNRLKQKANKLLEKQKQEIDEKANNVELLSDVGRKITSSLSIEKIIGTVYKNVNTLMDANVFGIGIYNDALKRIEFPSTYENGEPLPFYTNGIDDENRYGSVCFKESKEIIINNLDQEYKDHIQEVATPHEGGQPVSIIFLPLISKAGKLGVLTVQSFKKDAYSDYQLFMLRNIATYTTIAIENAESYDALNSTLSTLKSAQTQLIQSEKMASLGELTAGIAHEIQNPLNFVNNFSEVNNELIEELKHKKATLRREEQDEILDDIFKNNEKINHHGKRADAIVKGMLQHSQSSMGKKELTDINALADEYLRLSYHGLRAKDKLFNATLKTDIDASLEKVNVIPQDIGRVLLNLFNNAFYAVKEKKAKNTGSYEPTVSITTKQFGNRITVTVSDNGNGIPGNIADKIFQPFFSTKPTGQGTGLGLSLSYDIIKAHGGEIKVETKENEGTAFILELPIV